MKEVYMSTTSVTAIHSPLSSKHVLCFTFTRDKVLVRSEYSKRVEFEKLLQTIDGKFLTNVPLHILFIHYNIIFYCIMNFFFSIGGIFLIQSMNKK